MQFFPQKPIARIAPLLLAAALIADGCTKNVNVKLPDTPPRLSIYSYNETGRKFIATVGRLVTAADLRAGKSSVVKDATVALYTDGTFTENLQLVNAGVGSYEGTAVVAEGHHYELRVSAPGFDEATAAADVPDLVPLTRIEFHNFPERTSSAKTRQVPMGLWWTDPEATEDYYILRMRSGDDNAGVDSFFTAWSDGCCNFTDPSVQPSGSDLLGGSQDGGQGCVPANAILITDKLFNGREKYLTGWYDYYALSSGYDRAGNHQKSYAQLCHVSKVFYDYVHTYIGALATDGDPFVEPQNLPTNVHNGYGIFTIASVGSIYING